ncbi:hypothetical protein ACFX15_011893 [Malus domestica]
MMVDLRGRDGRRRRWYMRLCMMRGFIILDWEWCDDELVVSFGPRMKVGASRRNLRLYPLKHLYPSGDAVCATSSLSGSGKVCTCCALHREEVVLGSDSRAVSALHFERRDGEDDDDDRTRTADGRVDD